jgi:nucleotide-binding universal stress UspA family protein
VSKIIVGVDGSDRSDDALALASSLARGTGAEIVLARAYPYDDAAFHLGDSAQRHHLREDAQQTLDRLRAHADASLRITTRTIADPSPSRALHMLAERERAALVVIGSSHHGAAGRVFAGTTAERLLHGSPCSVAVAPMGFAPGGSISRIAVGWDRSAEADAALDAATAIARAVDAELRIVEVLDIQWAGTPAIIPGSGAVLAAHQPAARARTSLDELVAGLPDDLHVETAVVLGHPVADLVRQSEDADLLVLGSRGYGPRRAVLLGGVSGRVVRKAGCPVLVVPRGVETPLEALFRPVSQAEPAPARHA